MTTRKGQVALYLIMVLLGIVVLFLVNVNSFLAVRSKNRMMNAVDEAAIAVAKCQGRLLNEIGRMNVEHLRAAIRGEDWVDDAGNDLQKEQRRLSFLGPLDALNEANAVARDWGCEGGDTPSAVYGFRDHIAEIRGNPDLYPGGNDGPWGTYADALESALGGSPAVLPARMEMAHPGASGLFANQSFYDVLDGKAWCWFRRGGNARYLDMDPSQVELPTIDPITDPENSEVFSLHVTYKSWADSGWGGSFDERWTNFVCQVTGLTREDFSPRSTVTNPDHVWAFYEMPEGNGRQQWYRWSDSYNIANGFPIAGSIRPEYDVAGCVASCMMLSRIPQLRRDDKIESTDPILVTAEAKPLGTVEDVESGGTVPVTAYNGFIAPSRPGERIFTDAQLVLMGSIPLPNGVAMEPEWYEHIKHHSPSEPRKSGCRYCSLWAKWMDEGFRSDIRDWLEKNAETCRSAGGGPAQKGGYQYAH